MNIRKNKKASILITCSTFPRWNEDHTPSFVAMLANELSASYDVHILAPHYKGAKISEKMANVHIYRYRYGPAVLEKLAYGGGILENLKKNPLLIFLIPSFCFAQIFNIYLLCKKFDYSLIHSHWIIPQGLVAVLYKILFNTRVKLLITSHGGDLFALNNLCTRAIRKFTLTKADYVAVVSRAMKNLCIDIGTKKENICVAPMGVDLTKTFVIENKVNRKPYSLIYVGRIVEKKGVEYLIRAVAHLKDSYPSINATIIGSGPRLENLKILVRELDIEENIYFLGAVPNTKIPQYLQGAKIAVIPSVISSNGDQEGLGLSIIESMGCGCAVVSTDLPAIKDIVINEVTGLTSKSANEKDLANKIDLLFRDNKKLEELSMAGRAFALNNFDWTVVTDRYIKIINSLISEFECDS